MSAVPASSRVALTSFLGRRAELGQLRALLGDARLVTITGPGGAGKTRLAEELVDGLARSFSGTAAAYLASASEPNDVVEIVASALGLHHRGETPLRAQLVEYLRDRRLLLLLDNCEHVATAATELVAEVLTGTRSLVIVATSRQPLHVPGEQVFPVGGLPLDTANELFVARASLVAPDLRVDGVARTAIEQICARLDGLPLAIELAAGLVRGLAVDALAARLQGHLADLASRSTVVPERQRTLRQALGWSNDLLSELERGAWRRLAVFSGGFALDGAEAVIAWPPLERDEVADLVGDLVDRSIVVFDQSTHRYRLLEVVREYARERLREAGEEAVALERHRRWLVDVANDTERRWFGSEQDVLADRLEAEVGNLRAALDGCEESGAFSEGLTLANAGYWYWLTRASLEEGLRQFRRFLGRSGDPVIEARAHWRAGYLATIRNDFAAANELLSAAFEYASVADDAFDRAYATGISGLLLLYEHPDQAEEARRRCREMADNPAGDRMARQWGLIGAGLASLALGDFAECRRACVEAAEIGRTVDELWGRELGLRFLGQAEWRLGRLDAAEEVLLECVRLDRRLKDLWHTGWSAEALAWVAADAGRPERGAGLLGIAAAVWARTGLSLGYPYRAWHERAAEKLRDRLGARKFDAEFAAGREMSRDEAIAFALYEKSHASVSPESPLSDRELEVAALVADGLGNRAIAEKLFLSPRTVEKHVQHVMDKLGLGSRAEIAAWHARLATR